MIVAINYSNDKFKEQQKYNTLTTYKYGKVDKVIEYSPKDLDNQFREENKELLQVKRGGGLWLWKPYIILKTLNQLNDGDFLFYIDSGAYCCNDIHLLVNILETEKKDILAFLLPLMEFQWTKKETFDFFKESDFSRNQFLSGYFILRKSDITVKFVTEWLECMKKPICSSPVDTSESKFSTFISHREDQSVFSLLCYKYNVIGHRDPSQYGDYPWLYKSTNVACRFMKFSNSPYPRIVVSERSVKPKKFKFKLFILDCLDKLDLFRFFWDKYK